MHNTSFKLSVLLIKRLCFFTLIAEASVCFSQDSTKNANDGFSSRVVDGHSLDSPYVVAPGVHPATVIPIAKQFQYPEFQDGRIYYSTGKYSEVSRINYCLLYDAMQIIDSNSDTVWLDKTIVQYVQIGADFYFCDLKHGYFRLLNKDQNLKLMIKSMWIVAQKWPLHPHWTSIESPQRTLSVDEFIFPSEYVTFIKAGYYSFQGPMNKVYQPTKRSLIKVFPKEKKAIKKYVREHKIDFTDGTDLKKVVAFCNGLS